MAANKENPQKSVRVCVTRCGYAVIPGGTDEEIEQNVLALKESDFDWEPVDSGVLAMAEIVEECGPSGKAK